MGVREFIHNTRFMIRGGFPKGLPIEDLEPAYHENYPQCTIPKPSAIIYGCHDWPTVFKNCKAFSEWFNVNKSKKILVLDKAEPDLRKFCQHNQYGNYNAIGNELSSVSASGENSEESDGSDGESKPTTKAVQNLKTKTKLRTRSLSRSREGKLPILLLERCENKENTAQLQPSKRKQVTEPQQSTSQSSRTVPKKQYKRIIPPPTSSSETDTERENRRTAAALIKTSVSGPVRSSVPSEAANGLSTQAVVPEIRVKKEPGIECEVREIAMVAPVSTKVKLEEADLGVLNLGQQQPESQDIQMASDACEGNGIELKNSVAVVPVTKEADATPAASPQWEISDDHSSSEGGGLGVSTDVEFNHAVKVQASEQGDTSAGESDQSSTPAKIPKMIGKHGTDTSAVQQLTPSEPGESALSEPSSTGTEVSEEADAQAPQPESDEKHVAPLKASAEVAKAGTSREKDVRSSSARRSTSTRPILSAPAPFSKFVHPNRLHPAAADCNSHVYYDQAAGVYYDYTPEINNRSHARSPPWNDDEMRAALKDMCQPRSCRLCGIPKLSCEAYAISHYNGGRHDHYLKEFLGNRGAKRVKPEEFKGNLLVNLTDSKPVSQSHKPTLLNQHHSTANSHPTTVGLDETSGSRKRKRERAKKKSPLPSHPKANLWKEKCLSIWRRAKKIVESPNLAWVRNRTDYPRGFPKKLQDIGTYLENGTCTSPHHFGKQMAYVLKYIRQVHMDPHSPGFANVQAIDDIMRIQIPEVVANFETGHDMRSSTRPQ